MLSFLAFPKTLLVPEEFLNIQHAVVVAKNGDTVSVNFGRPNGERVTVTTSRIFGKEIAFEVRDEERKELLKKVKEITNADVNLMNKLSNIDGGKHQHSSSGWQGQQQVNEPDELYDACWGCKNIIFDDQNKPWVFWGGKPTSNGNMWAYYTFWNDESWVGDSVAIPLPGPERWDCYSHRAALGINSQPYLVCNVQDPYNLEDIFYTHYNGSEWEPKRMVNLPDSTELDFQPHIAANGNQMWVNWFGGVNDVSRYDIYMSRWNGNGFTPEEVISSDDYHNWFQNLAVDSRGNPHVVWIALDMVPPYDDVVFYRYHDGSRWLEPETVMKGMLLTHGNHWSKVDIELDEEDNPHVIFDAKDTNAQSFDIYCAKKDNGRWIEPERVTNNEYNDAAPLIAVYNAHNIWIVWWREEGTAHIIACHYDGQTWSSEMTLDGNLSYDNGAADLKFDRQGKLWLIYNGYPYGRAENEIYYDIYTPAALTEKPQSNKLQVRTIASNPFSHSTTISYNLTNSTPIKVEVFDILGKQVGLLETGFKLPGFYTLNWAGKDRDGKKLPNGIYFISLKLGKEKEVIPVILIK